MSRLTYFSTSAVLWRAWTEASTLYLLFRRSQSKILLENPICFLHSGIVLGECFYIRAILTMDLAVFQRWLSTKAIRNNMFVNRSGSRVDLVTATLAVWDAILAAATKRQLANGKGKFLALETAKVGHAPTLSFASHAP